MRELGGCGSPALEHRLNSWGTRDLTSVSYVGRWIPYLVTLAFTFTLALGYFLNCFVGELVWQ